MSKVTDTGLFSGHNTGYYLFWFILLPSSLVRSFFVT